MTVRNEIKQCGEIGSDIDYLSTGGSVQKIKAEKADEQKIRKLPVPGPKKPS